MNCVYCFEKHDSEHEMSYETAVNIVDYVCERVEKDATIEFLFFGGEPLLRFELIQYIVQYVFSKHYSQKCRFFASTNGTLLSSEMKEWFQKHKDVFILGLSLDGSRESHNFNRSQSFDKIDIDFFRKTWPNQNVKMTVSEHTLSNYAKDVVFIHSMGFGINGGEICLGNNNWQKKGLLEVFAKQLMLLIDYYSNSNGAFYNALFDIDIALCAAKKRFSRKHCGVGDKLFFLIRTEKDTPVLLLLL